MKLDSKIFDRIRVRPNPDRLDEDVYPACEWQGCERPGTHRAPKGRDREGQYFHFCIDHVRDYNKSYNYFAGMDEGSVRAWQKDSITGHRPTWKMGVNAKGAGQAGFDPREAARARAERRYGGTNGFGSGYEPRRRKLKALEQRAFDTLGLNADANAAEIKVRYKDLVKRHHPDANGGDRSSEERLRQIIQAYTLLRKAGMC